MLHDHLAALEHSWLGLYENERVVETAGDQALNWTYWLGQMQIELRILQATAQRGGEPVASLMRLAQFACYAHVTYAGIRPLDYWGVYFSDLIERCGRLHDEKQADYGRDHDPFANVSASTDWGIAAWVGAMVRATDKVRRMEKFAETQNLKNETVVDSFEDLIVYCLIARVLYQVATVGSALPAREAAVR